MLITAFATKAGAYFMANSGHLSPADRRTIAIQSVTIQAVVLSIFVAFGPLILHFFHVSISALEVAGGLILLLFAINLVLVEDHSAYDTAPKPGIGMAAYPLAVPLLLRVVALLLAALAVEMMALGLRGYGILPPMPGVTH